MPFKFFVAAVTIGLWPLSVFAQEDVFGLSCRGTETSLASSEEPTVRENIRKSFIIRGSEKMIAADVSRREAALGVSPSGLCPTENVILWKMNSEFITIKCLGQTLANEARRDTFIFYRTGKSLDYIIEFFRAPDFATPTSKTTFVASCNERKF